MSKYSLAFDATVDIPATADNYLTNSLHRKLCDLNTKAINSGGMLRVRVVDGRQSKLGVTAFDRIAKKLEFLSYYKSLKFCLELNTSEMGVFAAYDEYARGNSSYDELVKSNIFVGAEVSTYVQLRVALLWLGQTSFRRYVVIRPTERILPPFNERSRRLVGASAGVSWVIVRGQVSFNIEGKGAATPMHPDWVRCIRDACKSHSIPFMFDGWGAWAPADGMGEDLLSVKFPVAYVMPDGRVCDPKGERMPGGEIMYRCGSMGGKGSVPVLDGVLHTDVGM